MPETYAPARTVYDRIKARFPFLTVEEKHAFDVRAAPHLVPGQSAIHPVRAMLACLNNPHALLVENRPLPPIDSEQWRPTVILRDRVLALTIPTWDPGLVTETRINGLVGACIDRRKDYDAVIIDVRGNAGGSTDLAHQVASIFFSHPVLYGTSIERTDAGLRRAPCVMEKLSPHGTTYIAAPVALLTDGACFSANELFLAPFHVAGRGTLIGATTRGGSACPLSLPLKIDGQDVTALIPTRRFFLPGATAPLETTRIKPDIPYSGSDILDFAARHLLKDSPAPTRPDRRPAFNPPDSSAPRQ